MWLFYAVALGLLCAGVILWRFDRNRIVVAEALGGGVLAFVVAAIIHAVAVSSMVSDVETWSGQIYKVVHYPRWIEEYEITHYTHDSKGNVTGSYTTTHYRTHHEHWAAYTTLHDDYNIRREFYEEAKRNFNDYTVERPYKSGFYSGDHNIYVAYNKTGYIYPVTATRGWTNRVKAAPSVFSFPKVPKELDKYIFDYQCNADWRRSNRLVGSAGVIDLLEFDRMNARLGPTKLVNVIMVGFLSSDASYGKWLEAKWIGGKKNDLVICFGGDHKNPSWVYVFGWTEKQLVKRELESTLLLTGISTEALPTIENIIRMRYVIKDWTKFDYISVEPPFWSYVVFFIAIVISQVAYWIWVKLNDFVEEDYSWRRNFSRP